MLPHALTRAAAGSCLAVLLAGCAPQPALTPSAARPSHTAAEPAPVTSSSARAEDLTALREVTARFRRAIQTRDKPAFLALFHDMPFDRIVWQSVVDDDSLATIRKKHPQAIKARHRPDNNPVAFIDEIVASATAQEEVFGPLTIDTDGEVASIAFDYVYLDGGRETNRGRELWLLVRTERGWKITSVVYTVRFSKARM